MPQDSQGHRGKGLRCALAGHPCWVKVALVLLMILLTQWAWSSPNNDAEMDDLLPQLSNWGRWGAEDQLGTLNYLTNERARAAAALIRTGQTISLARNVPMIPANLRSGKYSLLKYTDPPPEESGCIDNIAMVYHGFTVTHIDALCHFFTPLGAQGMYNGFSLDQVTPTGADRLGVEVMGQRGIVGRGVLLDIAALKGGPLKVGSAILPEDLEAAEQAEGVTVGEGDILIVRNGAGAANRYQLATGLHPSCLLWMQQRRIALLCGDSDNDVHPALPGFFRWSSPIHMVALPYMGLPLLDQAELEELSQACKLQQRYTFFVTVAPWRLKGTTGSPVNPLVVF